MTGKKHSPERNKNKSLISKKTWKLTKNTGEIIIINNNVDLTPKEDILSHKKIRLLAQDGNIFVNPAWNLGVKESKFNNITICNDDLTFAPDKYFGAFPKEFLESTGITVTNFGSPEEETVRIVKMSNWKDVPYGAGSLFSLHKSNYIEIPERLKIMWGDTFLFLNLFKTKQMYSVNGLSGKQTFGTTWQSKSDPVKISIISQVINSDGAEWGKIFKEYSLSWNV